MIDLAQDAPGTLFLAGDEATLYLQPTEMAVWAVRGQPPRVPAHPNREKVNFFATLDLHSGKEIVLRTTQLSGEGAVAHLEQLLAAYPERGLVLLWDRATWHKGQLVRDFLATHARLEVLYLPPGAPDLNPQEHVWKAARQEVSHNHLVPKLTELADRFERHLLQSTFPSSFLRRYGYGTCVCPNSI
jgi:transposase